MLSCVTLRWSYQRYAQTQNVLLDGDDLNFLVRLCVRTLLLLLLCGGVRSSAVRRLRALLKGANVHSSVRRVLL